MPKCDYGCGQEATHQFKKGKWCCDTSSNKCPVKRKQISETNKGCTSWMKGLSAKTDPRVAKLGRKISKKTKGRKKSKESIEKYRKSVTPERRKQYSKRMKENNPMKDPETVKRKVKKNSGKSHPYYGKKRPDHSKRMKGDNNPSKRPEVKKKLRLKRIEMIENNIENGYQITPCFNTNACALIDEYGKRHGYQFQHAMNGGEYKIDELGYWVDGYDKERNTVIEVDEAHHFDMNGNLSEKDIRRQAEIEEFLGCDFIRLRI